jgi:hypothetical protein
MVTREEAEAFLYEALAKGVLKPKKVAKKAAAPKKAVTKTEEDEEIED